MAKKASTGNEGRTLGDRSQTGAIQQGDFGEIVGNEDASDRMSMCIGSGIQSLPYICNITLQYQEIISCWKSLRGWWFKHRHIFGIQYCSHVCFGWMTQPPSMQ